MDLKGKNDTLQPLSIACFAALAVVCRLKLFL
jgi:hypothetical protein